MFKHTKFLQCGSDRYHGLHRRVVAKSCQCRPVSEVSGPVLNHELSRLEGDVDVPKLSSELNLLASFVKEVQPDLKDITSIQTVIDVMKQGKLTKVFSELHSVIKLYLTVPLSNATAERSFSALRRIKTYLRSTLTQEHLNHFLVLNAHRELLDRIDVNEVCQSVMKVNERRRKYFGC